MIIFYDVKKRFQDQWRDKRSRSLFLRVSNKRKYKTWGWVWYGLYTKQKIGVDGRKTPWWQSWLISSNTFSVNKFIVFFNFHFVVFALYSNTSKFFINILLSNDNFLNYFFYPNSCDITILYCYDKKRYWNLFTYNIYES